MKVEESRNKPSNTSGVTGTGDRRVSNTRESSFQSQLRQVEGRNFDEQVNALAEQIGAQGEKLGKKIDIRELKIYKTLIAEFLGLAVGNSHKFSKQSFLDRRGRHRVYALIKKINEELDLLTKEILSEEKDNIAILQRLEDIRGLILDMLM